MVSMVKFLFCWLDKEESDLVSYSIFVLSDHTLSIASSVAMLKKLSIQAISLRYLFSNEFLSNGKQPLNALIAPTEIIFSIPVAKALDRLGAMAGRMGRWFWKFPFGSSSADAITIRSVTPPNLCCGFLQCRTGGGSTLKQINYIYVFDLCQIIYSE